MVYHDQILSPDFDIICMLFDIERIGHRVVDPLKICIRWKVLLVCILRELYSLVTLVNDSSLANTERIASKFEFFQEVVDPS